MTKAQLLLALTDLPDDTDVFGELDGELIEIVNVIGPVPCPITDRPFGVLMMMPIPD